MFHRFALLLSLLITAPLCFAQTPGAERPDTATRPTEKGEQATQKKPAAAAKLKVRQTPEDAQKFVAEAEKKLADLAIRAGRAAWVQATYITDDTEVLAAEANETLTAAATAYAKEAAKFNGLKLPYDTDRKLKLLKLALVVPAPDNEKERQELTRITVGMESAYGKGKFCPPSEKTSEGKPKCYTLNDAERVMRESFNEPDLRKVWTGWHSVAPAYRKQYSRFVELGNKGAREMGYQDMGALWRSNYDMEPEAFAAEMERLWQQVRPLYESLHTYVRSKLVEKYGPNVVPPDGPIPAHLLGNMWAQQWGNIYPLVAPPSADPGYDLTKILQARKTDARQMVRYGENFYVSLGFDKLPDTFWERSLFTKPEDRDVVCHASAWDIDAKKDVRIKMCIEPNDEDFSTIHHELGHNYYQMAYAPQPPLYQGSANDGFHEAIGDAIALSVTPEYLKQLDFIQTVPDASADLGLLMKQALDKVAFLPFGYLIDQWRWNVFSGKTSPAEYNKAWWELRTRYQGIAPPESRGEQFFDAGAKYHVAGNTPYARYFLAHILQFQFQRAMCRQAGFRGPLHRCSIYNDKEVGKRLEAMLAMGASRPWPEALKALTGEDRMDATAIIDYFAPLKKWLDEQNKGKKVGWGSN